MKEEKRFFPRLFHLTTSHGGLVTLVGKEEKRAALVEYLSCSLYSFEDGFSVLKVEQIEDPSLRALSISINLFLSEGIHRGNWVCMNPRRSLPSSTSARLTRLMLHWRFLSSSLAIQS